MQGGIRLADSQRMLVRMMIQGVVAGKRKTGSLKGVLMLILLENEVESRN